MERLSVTLCPENTQDKFERQRVSRIEAFMREHGMTATIIERSLLLLEDPALEPVTDEYAQKYLTARAEAEQKRIANTCMYVAKDAQASGYAMGTLATPDGVENFLSWGNHVANYDNLPDRTAVGFDLTAAENLGRYGVPVHVLAIHSNSLEQLTEHMGQLYGGEWNNTTDERREFGPQH